MGQQQDGTEATRKYEEARGWLAFLIDNPDKTVSVPEYRKQLQSARRAVANAHKAMMEARA